MGQYERGAPRVVSAPALGYFEGASASEHRAQLGNETLNVLGAWLRDLEGHGVGAPSVEIDVSRGEVLVEHVGHVAVKRH